jgi:hypothetical protein
MLPRLALLAFVTCVSIAEAGPTAASLVGKWLWHGIDSESTMTFRADHTYILESIGLQYHDSRQATWQVHGNQLTISWPDGKRQTEAIVKLTSDTLILRAEEGGLRLSRVE